jgi:hypothetical protein
MYLQEESPYVEFPSKLEIDKEKDMKLITDQLIAFHWDMIFSLRTHHLALLRALYEE